MKIRLLRRPAWLALLAVLATAPATAQTVSSGGAGPTEHHVLAGETLASIASQYNITVEALRAANPGTTQLLPGQVLEIPPANGAPAAAPMDEEVYTLSPFVVDASQDIGYYAENTLAGSRLNTNIGDLASSITVVTKQQLVDTAAVDINDVFMYEASTEGANTYTQTDITRNGIPRDTIAGYSSDQGVPFTNATANRVRGLGAADTAQNNYPSISRVPFDAYNTNSLEISRGPNSLLFGIGSPAGIVNQSTADAVLDRRATHLEARLGSWGSERFTFSHNQPLVDDKLAVYVAALYDSVGYRRKPSEDITRRQYAALTFKPFPKTRITANFENYHNFNNRPNSQTPRDYVTPWLEAGRPSYNPVTRMLTIEDTGEVKGPYAFDTRSPGAIEPVGNSGLTSTTSPLYVPGIQFGIGGSGRVAEFTDRGNILHIVSPVGAPFTSLEDPYTAYNAPPAASRTPEQWILSDRRLTSSTGPRAPEGYGNWIQPSTTDQSIYDWERINLLQMNYGELDQQTYNIEIQQEILPKLNLALGWFRQDLEAWENYSVSNANAITTLYVDTNKYLMDGTPNPHFGDPFLLDISPDTFHTPEENDNYRAMLAYELDFTRNDGFIRWLGRHRLVGLWSRQDSTRSTYRYRYSFDGGDLRYQADPSNPDAIIASSNISRVFYVGDNEHGVVDYAPGRLGQPGYGGPETGPVKTYNWQTGQWETSELHFSQNLFYAGFYGPLQRVITGKSLALQSHFWDDRIVTTFGWRRDDYKARQTDTDGLTTEDLYENGLAIDPGWTRSRLTDWFEQDGETRTTGIVFRPIRWDGGDISLHYNKSDNFNPPNGVPIDFFGTPLPKSTGEGKDYGIGVSMFQNKLTARLNWFESTNENAPATSATTAIGRVIREDTASFRSWANFVVRIRHGEDPSDPDFANNSAEGHQLTEQMKNEIAELMQVPSFDNWPPSGISGTQDNKAKGVEFQLIYNPKPNWTIKATGAKVHSTFQNVAPELDAWVGDADTPGTRMYVWTHATAPDMPEEFTLNNGTPVSLRNFWTGYGFNADARLSNADGANPSWTSPKGFWESAVATEINVSKALQGKTVPNEREWSFNVLTNYAIQEGRLRGLSFGGAVRWADEAIAGFYGDTENLDSAGNIVAADLNRPIMVEAETHVDLWAAYTMKIFEDRVRMKVQFNVRDVFESGGLQPIAFNLDGSAFAYRIVDPRQFYLTTSFDF